MDSKTTVLFAIPTLDTGGPDRVFFELLSHIDRAKFKPLLLVQKRDGTFLKRLPADVEVHVVGNRQESGAGYSVLETRRVIQRLAPDIVVSTLRMTFTVTAALLGMRRGPVHLIRPANHLSENARELIRTAPIKHRLSFLANIAMLYLSDGVICQSRAIFDDLSRYAGLKSKAWVIGNPIEPSRIFAQAEVTSAEILGSPSLISIGRLMPQKGYDLLIDAVRSLVIEYPKLHLTVIGEGPDRDKLALMIGENGLEAHVTLAGFIQNPYPWIRASDLFVSSSRYEGFPNVVLEALALGKPIVASDCPGGTRDIVRPGISGWLCEPNNAVDLAHTIRRALLERFSRSSEQLVNFCEQNFSTAKITGLYENAISSALSSARR